MFTSGRGLGRASAGLISSEAMDCDGGGERGAGLPILPETDVCLQGQSCKRFAEHKRLVVHEHRSLWISEVWLGVPEIGSCARQRFKAPLAILEDSYAFRLLLCGRPLPFENIAGVPVRARARPP